MSFCVRVVGVGDAFTSRYWNACLLVEHQGERLLIDAPPALARALADLGTRGGEPVGLDQVDHVLVTHLHGDHMGGLEQLLFWRRFVTRRPCTLHACEEVLAGLWQTRLRGGMDTLMDLDGARHAMRLEDYATVHPLPPPGETARIAGLDLTWRPTVHHIPTSAIRISLGRSTFGYSADTAFDPSLLAWLGRCDGFLHETNLGVHTPLEQLMTAESSLRARMRLIHYPDALDADAAPIPCAREGDRYDFG